MVSRKKYREWIKDEYKGAKDYYHHGQKRKGDDEWRHMNQHIRAVKRKR